MTPRLPLEGITVVSIEQAVAAPICTARLVDAGARVIKVERASGDFARGYDSAAGGDSSYFGWANLGKESIVLDIKDAEDAALLHRMIGAADVFVQNLAPGALERLGFGAPALRKTNPRLVTCDVSGYGDSPAVAKKRAYDLLVQAESGLIAVSGPPNELGRIGVSICDVGTGVTAYAAILEALVGRSVSGEGAALGVSLFDVAAEWMTVPFLQHAAGMAPRRVGLRHPTIAPYGAYETGDGALTLISIQNEREWVRLCEDVLGNAAMAVDARFVSNEERVANRPALEDEVSALVASMDAATFRVRLDDAAIAWGAINGLDELAVHAALRTRQGVSSSGLEFRLPAHPVRSDRKAVTRKAPAVGEHSDALRAEFTAT
ncbi:MAG: CaiB/BaiF CoA-transferase family protein [Actinomycetota bacterium]